MPDGSTKKKAIDKLREIEDQIARRVYLPEQSIPKFSRSLNNGSSTNVQTFENPPIQYTRGTQKTILANSIH
jgi:hypothetical protein